MNIIKPMKMMASISALCVVMTFSSITSVNAAGCDAAFDSPRHHQKGDCRQHSMKRMMKELSLSESQQAQIKALKTEAREQHVKLRDAMKKFREEERELSHAKVFDEQAFKALHATYQPTFVKMALTRAKTQHAIFNVLTSEQQEKWVKIMEKRKEKFNKKRD